MGGVKFYPDSNAGTTATVIVNANLNFAQLTKIMELVHTSLAANGIKLHGNPMAEWAKLGSSGTKTEGKSVECIQMRATIELD